MHPQSIKYLVDPQIVNIDAIKLRKVVKRFESQHRKGAFPGGQLTLRRDGQLIASASIGIARGHRPSEDSPPIPVASQTVFPALSMGKPLVATAIALLEDREVLNVHTPIAHFIPGFTGYGKDEITLLDVLTHRSGILMPDFVKKNHLWGNHEEIRAALIKTLPSYPRGTLAYHPYEYGWILNEILLEVDGRDLPTFFKEEIAAPLNLPALAFGLAGRDVESFAFQYWLGPQEVVVAGSNVAKDFEWQNSEDFFKANNPAVSLVTNAESIAAFYDFLVSGGRTPGGRQLISRDLLQQYTTQSVFGWDKSLKTTIGIGRGFVIGTWFPSSFGWWNTRNCFGHAGGFSSLAFGDYEKKISIAIVTNGNRSLSDFVRRFMPIAQGLRNSCRK
jgi:CubicO group peptidase (beta-lactamase class C family)